MILVVAVGVAVAAIAVTKRAGVTAERVSRAAEMRQLYIIAASKWSAGATLQLPAETHLLSVEWTVSIGAATYRFWGSAIASPLPATVESVPCQPVGSSPACALITGNTAILLPRAVEGPSDVLTLHLLFAPAAPGGEFNVKLNSTRLISVEGNATVDVKINGWGVDITLTANVYVSSIRVYTYSATAG